MTSPPVISIITITMNDRDGLRKTSESVLRQEGLDQIEWVIVDGGSTDGTLTDARAYARDLRAPARTTVLEGPDKGIVDAMSRGAKVARGEYLQFLNSGDRYHTADSLTTVLARIGSCRPRAERPSWLYGQCRVVDAKDGPVRPLHARRYSRIGHAYHFVRINHQAVFVHRQVFGHAGGFRPSAGSALDFDLLLRLGELASPEVLNEVLIDYLEGGISQTRFVERMRLAGTLRREVLALTGVVALADQLFTSTFIAYGIARSRAKRLAVHLLGERFLRWWGRRQIGLLRRKHDGGETDTDRTVP